MADAVEFGGEEETIGEFLGNNPPEVEEKKEDEEEGKEDNKSGKEGEEEGDDSEDDDEEGDEIDLEKETDPEKLRAAAIRHKKASESKTENLKNLRQRRRDAVIRNAGNAKVFEAVYKGDEVTLVKDLPKEKQDEMSEDAKKIWDDAVKVKTRVNDDAKIAFDKEQDEANKNLDTDIVLDDEIEELAQGLALELTGNDKRKANEIIKHFNKFNNTGLKENELVERIKDAAKLAGSYVPPRDQIKKPGGGKPVKKSGADPHGVDSIVESVSSNGAKQTFSL